MSAPDLLRAPAVALYGGSFDPVHAGHLFCARAVLAGGGADGGPLDGVVLVPAHRSPFKRDDELAPDADRLDLVRAAVAGEPRMEAWDFELERGGVSYTIDTVQRVVELRGEDAPPPALVIGSDNLAGLGGWYRIEELLRLARPLVVRREPRARVEAHLAALAERLAPELVARLADGVLDADVTHPASATELRAAIARDAVPDGWLPPAVHALIRARGLYGAPRSAAEGERGS